MVGDRKAELSFEGPLDEAKALYQEGKVSAAEEMLKWYLEREPNSFGAHLQLGGLLLQQGFLSQAAIEFRSCTELKPCSPEGHLNLAVTYRLEDDLFGALNAIRRTLEIAPDWPEAWYNLGRILAAADEPVDAVSAYETALRLRPNWDICLNALGCAWLELGQHEKARDILSEAVRLAPESTEPIHNLAHAWHLLGCDAEAIVGFRRAVALDPTCAKAHLALGLLLLRNGEFAEGWQEYEWRFRAGFHGHTPHRPQRLWEGQRYDHRVLLLSAEQGCGSIIQFVRFAPRVKALGGTLLVEAPSQLVRLLGTCPGVDGVIESGATCDADFQFPLMSIPSLLRLDKADLFSGAPPYLYPPMEDSRRKIDEMLSTTSGLRIGIVWSGNRRHPLNSQRSCSPREFSALTEIPGVSLLSVQHLNEGFSEDDLRRLGIASIASCLGDFAHTASVVSALDLVITVDTAMAHLAGALNKPAWVLLSEPSDWRWMKTQSESPWYPSLTLFRQRDPGDWGLVFKELREKLLALTPAENSAGPVDQRRSV